MRVLEGQSRGLRIEEIARRTTIPLSTVKRIVESLRTEQFIIAATPGSGVRLGPLIKRLSESAVAGIGQVIRPLITDLSKRLGETVDLSILDGRAAVLTDQIQGANRLRAVSTVGDAFPLHCTAHGKALLSVLSDDKLIRLISGPLPKLTPNTIVGPTELIRAIKCCRRIGIASDDEEHTEGISALATGFVDPRGRALAMSIPVPTSRFARIRPILEVNLLACRRKVVEALSDTTSR